MNIVDLPMHSLKEAPWNANVMDEDDGNRLFASLRRFGLVQNLVVREVENGLYEILSGNQRLKVLKEQGATHVPCVVVDLDDSGARLLAQALNRIHGEDDLGLRAELIRSVLAKIPEADVLGLLPDTAQSLASLSELGTHDLAAQLRAWQQAQAVRLRHITLQVSEDQLGVVEQALARASEIEIKESSNPNKRGNALYALCRFYLEAQA